MPNTHDTAYPRLKNSFSPQELTAVFTPTAEEFALAHQLAHSTRLRICFLALLKTFQRLGYFLPLRKIPRQVTEHISLIYGVHYEAVEWAADDASGSRVRHTALIRKHFGVRPFDESGKQTLAHWSPAGSSPEGRHGRHHQRRRRGIAPAAI